MVSEQNTATSSSSSRGPQVSQLSTNNSKALLPLKLEPTAKLDHNNFFLWRQQVHAAIKGNRLSNFIDPSKSSHVSKNPDGSVNDDYLDWEQHDQILLCWLLSSISQEILPHLVGCTTSFQAWIVVEKFFSSKSRANLMQFKLQLQTLKKRGSSMTEYLLKKKSIIDALSYTV
ncbi:hypothetical protein Ddye_011249 [Dipteronia dyeriana]|uniref:Retrotransposon Copia-like N-terminal domain-containing protein n=1 Tax=Dipteronia dyeriana TaxID=168575 RepID=A0AAD9X217_9ROSI|nr:hypothetical protein Ddye_011249 [Dipteronia dyeriana]